MPKQIHDAESWNEIWIECARIGTVLSTRFVRKYKTIIDQALVDKVKMPCIYVSENEIELLVYIQHRLIDKERTPENKRWPEIPQLAQNTVRKQPGSGH